MTVWTKLFGAARTRARSLESMVAGATQPDPMEELRAREQAASVSSPLYKRMKSLPELEPWQRELVPWATGAVEYAERYGSMARDLRIWRLAVFVVAAAAVARDVQQQTSIQKLAARPSAEAYMFETCNGQARTVLSAERVPEPDEPRILAAIGSWMLALRTVATERGANAANMESVFAMVSRNTPAHEALKKWYAEHDPFKASERVDVQVFPPTRVGASNRVKVEWVERARNPASGQMEEAQYAQYVTYAISRSSRYEDLAANLLGIYVTDLSPPSRLR